MCRRHFGWVLLVAVFVGGWSLSALAAQARVNAAAPDFTSRDTTGAVWRLSALRGQYVVLEWFNHDCPFVRKHYNSGNMQALQRTYTDRGVVWLSINSSAPGKQGYVLAAQANALMEEKGASPTAVLLDPEGTIGRLYGAKTTPHLFIINPDGMLLYAGAIDDRPSTNPGDIPQSTNYVRQALDAAMAGQPVAMSATKSYGCSVKY